MSDHYREYLLAVFRLVLGPTLNASRAFKALPAVGCFVDDTRSARIAPFKLRIYEDIVRHGIDFGSIDALESFVINVETVLHSICVAADIDPDDLSRRRNPMENRALWEDVVARWDPYYQLVNLVWETFYEQGLEAAVEAIARSDPVAFWRTFWHLPLRTPHLLGSAQARERLIEMLCDRLLPRLLFSAAVDEAQDEACRDALAEELQRLDEPLWENLGQEMIQRAFVNAGIVIGPLRDALSSRDTLAMHDLPPQRLVARRQREQADNSVDAASRRHKSGGMRPSLER